LSERGYSRDTSPKLNASSRDQKHRDNGNTKALRAYFVDSVASTDAARATEPEHSSDFVGCRRHPQNVIIESPIAG